MTRRAIELTGTDVTLELSKVTGVKTNQRLTANIKQLEALQ